LSRPRRKWVDIIEIDLQEEGCGRMDYIGLGQDREMGKIERKRAFSRPSRKRDDIIEIDHKAMGYGRMDCIGVGQDREMGKLEGK